MTGIIIGLIVLSGTLYYAYLQSKHSSEEVTRLKEKVAKEEETLIIQHEVTKKAEESYESAKKSYLDRFSKYIRKP